MFDQLDIVEERYEQLNELLSDPDVVNDADKLRKYSKEQVVALKNRYRKDILLNNLEKI